MTKFQKFEYLAKSVKAGKNAGLRIVSMGFIAFLALAIVLFLMLRESRVSEDKNPESMATITSPSLTQFSHVFEENEKHIQALQFMTQSLLNQVPPASLLEESTSAEKRVVAQKWQAREQAPSEVYGEKTSSTKETSNNSAAAAELMPHPRWTLAQGEWIHAVLESAINSELPGSIRAIVTEPAYSYRGHTILIPRGSRVIGQYLSYQSNGSASSRLFVIWNRIITPSGISFQIESPGVDDLGRSGMAADQVDTHFFKIFAQASLLSILGGGIETVGVSGQDQANSRNQLRQMIGENFRDSAAKSLNMNSISPTLHVNQGDSVDIFVAKDVDFFSVAKK